MNRPAITWIWLLTAAAAVSARDATDPPPVPDTQAPGEHPPAPAESLGLITVPGGFHVSLFAADPDLRQPIAFTFDDRGRLWVVECYSYPEWKAKESDRVLIFEDADGDGRFDRRTVFWDKGTHLTGIEIGFGGVWLCAAPQLLFIPDANGDDVPDGPPVVRLDGWAIEHVQHNVFNGLIWGPDGWLYGCHGILEDSLVGKPGTPAAARTRLNCGVWRYHPQRETFEVVAHGTTNPWGLDFNDAGEGFFVNCVIGHLWHLVPGARYERMYGQDFNPHAYALMGAASDHFHWGGGHWTSSRSGTGKHDEAGGGHAHCGAMVYLGDSWPDRYRDAFFTFNLHGRRVNQDFLVRRGSGYAGTHGPDFLKSGDPWIRCVALKYGPDGSVYLIDWSDHGECHDMDGVHRSSGRMFRVAYGEKRPASAVDVARLDDAALVALQSHRNDWFVRHARRLLQERWAAGRDMSSARALLREAFAAAPDTPRRLRALWALHATGGVGEQVLRDLLRHEDDVVRGWAVRLLFEAGPPSEETVAACAALAGREPSPSVRLSLASALQRIPPASRWPVAEGLLRHGGEASDRSLQLMIWYGIEPLVEADPPRAIALARTALLPQVARYLVRRAASGGAGMEAVLSAVKDEPKADGQVLMLEEILESLTGRADVGMPRAWPPVFDALAGSADPRAVQLAESLAVRFGDRRILPRLRKLLEDGQAPGAERTRALDLLVSARDPELAPVLHRLLDGPAALRGAVLRALAACPHADTPRRILDRYAGLTPAERGDAVHTLASRPAWAADLLTAVETGAVPRADLSAQIVRQLQKFEDPALVKRLEKIWGAIRPASGDKASRLAEYRNLLTPDFLRTANVASGRAVFRKTCATCHRLFGEGGAIGPDLTGSERTSLDYVLENVLDPSAIVGKDYLLTTVVMDDERMVSGIVRQETESAVTVQTTNETVTLPKSGIRERKTSPQSMMPENLLTPMSLEDVRDLVAFLALPAPPPEAAEKEKQ